MNFILNFDGGTSQVRTAFYSSGGNITVTAQLLAPQSPTWYFVTTGMIPNNIVGIAVNGISTTSAHTYGVKNAAHPFVIGGYETTGTMNGRIDEVAMWKPVLTAGERQRLYEDDLDKTNDSVVGGINRTMIPQPNLKERDQKGSPSPEVDSSTVALCARVKPLEVGLYQRLNCQCQQRHAHWDYCGGWVLWEGQS